MIERDDFGTQAPGASPGSPRSTPSQGQERWSAGEQAGPATWTDRVGGATEGETSETARAAQGVARKAAEQASRLAQEAGEGVQQAVGRQKDQAADRIAAVASALHEAARTLQQQQAAPLGRYAETAAERLERASGYLRERDLRGMISEAERFARQRPELFLAGSVLAGLALARFLKSSSRRSHASDDGYGSPPYVAEGGYPAEPADFEGRAYRPEGGYPGTSEGTAWPASSGPTPTGGRGDI